MKTIFLSQSDSLIPTIQDVLYGFSDFILWELGNSHILFTVLVLFVIFDHIRQWNTYISTLIREGYFPFKVRLFSIIGILLVVYLFIILRYATDIANIAISILFLLYLFYRLRTSYDWHLIYFLLLFSLPIILIPDQILPHIFSILTSVVDALQESLISIAATFIIPILAAFFAFISWREVSMKGEHFRETAFRDRFNESNLSYPLQPYYEADIKSVRVRERKGITYRFFRYFLLTNFHGEVKVVLSFKEEMNLNLLSVIAGIGISRTAIGHVSRNNHGDFVIISRNTTRDSIEDDVETVFNSICRNAGSGETFDVGEYTIPTIYYNFPEGVIRSFICRKELSLLRDLSHEDRVDMRLGRMKKLGTKSKTLSNKPLTYELSDNDSRSDTISSFYRTLGYIFYINKPLQNGVKRIRETSSRISPNRDELLSDELLLFSRRSDAPFHEGLYMIYDAYIDHSIIGVYLQEDRHDMKCDFIQIKSDNHRDNWNNTYLPIRSFHVDKFEDLDVEEIGNSLQHFPSHDLDAKYVLRSRGAFYTIYDLETSGWIIARWTEIDPQPGGSRIPQKVEIKYSLDLTSLNLEGTIWHRGSYAVSR